jgi:hypothetical protein
MVYQDYVLLFMFSVFPIGMFLIGFFRLKETPMPKRILWSILGAALSALLGWGLFVVLWSL